jgi:mono/diheme cytochrome c family protein
MKKLPLGLILFSLLCTQTVFAKKLDGEKLFKEYCWGCHHQIAQAFGPSFRSIANSRDRAQIIAQIADPKGTYKSLGYKRNSMPAFDDLNSSELEALADYIYKFKDKK